VNEEDGSQDTSLKKGRKYKLKPSDWIAIGGVAVAIASVLVAWWQGSDAKEDAHAALKRAEAAIVRAEEAQKRSDDAREAAGLARDSAIKAAVVANDSSLRANAASDKATESAHQANDIFNSIYQRLGPGSPEQVVKIGYSDSNTHFVRAKGEDPVRGETRLTKWEYEAGATFYVGVQRNMWFHPTSPEYSEIPQAVSRLSLNSVDWPRIEQLLCEPDPETGERRTLQHASVSWMGDVTTTDLWLQLGIALPLDLKDKAVAALSSRPTEEEYRTWREPKLQADAAEDLTNTRDNTPELAADLSDDLIWVVNFERLFQAYLGADYIVVGPVKK